MLKIEITQIHDLPEDISLLIKQANDEGFSFMQRLEDQWLNNSNRFHGRGEFLYVATTDNITIGICGVNKDPFTTDNGVARLRHLYVSPTHRNHGLGTKLVKTCLSNLDASFTSVRLKVPDAATAEFYEKLKFVGIDDPLSSHILELA